MNKLFYGICCIVVFIEIVIGSVIIGNKIRQLDSVCPCETPRAQDLEMAFLRNCDDEVPHCEDDPCCWLRAGVNKYTGDNLYICGICHNFLEMIPDGDGYIRLTFLDESEWLERKGW